MSLFETIGNYEEEEPSTSGLSSSVRSRQQIEWSKFFTVGHKLGQKVEGKFKFNCLCQKPCGTRRMGSGQNKDLFAVCAKNKEPFYVKIEDLKILLVRPGVDPCDIQLYVPCCVGNYWRTFERESFAGKNKSKKKGSAKTLLENEELKFCLNERNYGGLALSLDTRTNSPTFGCLMVDCWVCKAKWNQEPKCLNDDPRHAKFLYSTKEMRNPEIKKLALENIEKLKSMKMRMNYAKGNDGSHLNIVPDAPEIEEESEEEEEEKPKKMGFQTLPGLPVAGVNTLVDDEEDGEEDVYQLLHQQRGKRKAKELPADPKKSKMQYI